MYTVACPNTFFKKIMKMKYNLFFLILSFYSYNCILDWLLRYLISMSVYYNVKLNIYVLGYIPFALGYVKIKARFVAKEN